MTDPDNASLAKLYKAMKKLAQSKESANSMYTSGDTSSALAAYDAALALAADVEARAVAVAGLGRARPMATVEAQLHGNRAAALNRLDRVDDAIDACTRSLNLLPSYAKARKRRAELFMRAQRFQEATADIHELLRESPNDRELRTMLRQAESEFTRAALTTTLVSVVSSSSASVSPTLTLQNSRNVPLVATTTRRSACQQQRQTRT